MTEKDKNITENDKNITENDKKIAKKYENYKNCKEMK
jgi:hypothetical protein